MIAKTEPRERRVNVVLGVFFTLLAIAVIAFLVLLLAIGMFGGME